MSRSLKRFVSRRFASLQEEIQELHRINAAISARLDALEGKSKPKLVAEQPAPAPVFEVIETDQMTPDFAQDYLPSIVRDAQAQGKIAVFRFNDKYRHGIASPNDLDVQEGFKRTFRNEGVDELIVYMCGIGEILLTLQPGEQGTLTFSQGAWRAC